MKIQNEMKAEIRRGSTSWAFFYIALGFALGIEGTIIQMITPLTFPYNVALYIVTMSVTMYAFLFCGCFQNFLLSLKHKYENTAR